MAASQFRLVNVWTDPEPGPGGFNPMASSLLWLPEHWAAGDPSPAFVFVHRWGGYPYDPLAAVLGPALAERGYVFLSLCLRRRGMEGQLMALPDNDHRDIKLGIDYLQTNGCEKIFLLGEELGCISALNYQSKHGDRRVAGIALIDPIPAPAEWLSAAVGEDFYAERLRLAGIASRQGAGMDTRIDILPAAGPRITQQAAAFLAWWGPLAGIRLDRLVEALRVPLLALSAAGKEPPAELHGSNLTSVECDARQDPAGAVTALAAFAEQHGGPLLMRPALQMVHLAAGERRFFGLHWASVTQPDARKIIVLMHGLTSSPLSPLFLKMAPVLAQSAADVIAIEVRRSGWWGHETSLLDYDVEDIDAWLARLTEQGYEEIVLAGASIGSLSVGRYQSVKQHPGVVAIAHLMPTADCPGWFRCGVGAGPYQQAVEQAEAAIAAGRGDMELIDVDLRQPPPNKYGGRFRWTQRAASWLSWWGPQADSVNSQHIANAGVPLLLLSGTEDSYNDAARFAELKAAAVRAPSVEEIWYPDIDHGLAGVERQVAADMLAWLTKIGVL